MELSSALLQMAADPEWGFFFGCFGGIRQKGTVRGRWCSWWCFTDRSGASPTGKCEENRSCRITSGSLQDHFRITWRETLSRRCRCSNRGRILSRPHWSCRIVTWIRGIGNRKQGFPAWDHSLKGWGEKKRDSRGITSHDRRDPDCCDPPICR